MKEKFKIPSPRKHFISFLIYLGVNLASLLTLISIVFLVGYILVKGIPNLSFHLFAFKYTTENVSLFPALINTILIIILALFFALPAGIGSAIYLTEYAKKTNKLVSVVRVTSETLAGIPSIVYGLFGALLFVKYLHFGLSLLSGALTLAIMILPLIMRTTEEALNMVPSTYKEGSYGLGAGKLYTIFKVILPSAMAGILSGVILGIGRMIGESAALIFTAGTVEKVVTSVFDSSRTLAVHMYALSTEGIHMKETFGTAVALIVVVIVLNFLSSLLAKIVKGEK